MSAADHGPGSRASTPVRRGALPDWAARLAWPALALALLLAFNLVFTPGFFDLEIRGGRLYGTPVDVLNHGSRTAIVALGMALVIATAGVDLSVGAVMAISGALAAALLVRHGAPLPAAVLAALTAGLAAGLWNGALVAYLRIQPIVATLILMVAGRGAAQLITDGVILTVPAGDSPQGSAAFAAIAGGSLFGLPLPVTLAAGVLLLLALFTRRTALGMSLEAVGDNQTACRFAGLDARGATLFAYAVAGVCAALAGLIEASYIRAADANNAGLFVELDAILAVVLGGTALTGGRFSLVGAALGGLFIQALTKTLYLHDVSADVAPVPKALVVVAVCLLQSPAARDMLRRAARGAPPSPTTRNAGPLWPTARNVEPSQPTSRVPGPPRSTHRRWRFRP